MGDPCYCTVLRKATRRLAAHYDEALAPVGITVAQYSVLSTARRRGPISLTELARLLELDRSTMGRNVKVLERMGLVEPAPSEDQRETAVRLSAKGEAVYDAARPIWAETQARIAATLSPAGTATLLDQLDRL